MDEFIGIVKLFAGNFAPRYWMLCDGRMLSKQKYSGLFSLLGNTYGGDGISTFALPDLRGRVAVGVGQGTRLSPVNLGEAGGVESVTLILPEMPTHTHFVTVRLNAGSDTNMTDIASGNVLANEKRGGTDAPAIYTSDANVAQMRDDAATTTVLAEGGSQPHENRQPYLGLNYIICLSGVKAYKT